MASVVVSALEMTLSIFLNKARRSLAENLKDGDLNSQQLHSLIVSNMESIKTKIDGLARRELLSSASFIKDGLFLLNDLLDKSDDDVCPSSDEGNVGKLVVATCGLPAFDDVFGYVVRFKSWLKRSDKEADMTWANPDSLDFNGNVTRELIDAVSKLKKSSRDQFNLAIDSFKNAHTRATDEFFNESLSLQDRIIAAKLRIQSRLLLSLENPRLANVCKQYLNDLHDLPPIVEIFRSDLDGGLLSNFNKVERHELVQSVSMINFVLFRFLNSFTKELVNVYDWPLIENDVWMYNPLIPDETVLTELHRAEIDVPNLMSFKPIQSQVMGFDPKLVAINSKGDLILFRQRTNPDVCELLIISGNDVEVFYTFPQFTLVSFLAVNDEDSVFVFADNVESGIPTGYVMYDVLVFCPGGDISGIYKRFLLLDGSIVLAPTPQNREVALCVPDEILSKEGKIHCEVPEIRSEEKIPGEVIIRSEEEIQGDVIIRSDEKIPGEVNMRSEEKIQEEVPDIGSEEKIPGEVNIPTEMSMLDSILVEIKMWKSTLATFAGGLLVIAIEKFGYHIRIFTKDGRLVREFELHEGEREACVDITFNSLTKELVVVSRIENDYFLSTYLLMAGKRRHNVRLAHIGEDSQDIHLTSHCSGAMALVTKEHILYLQ